MNTIRPGSRAISEICTACRPTRVSALRQQGSRRSHGGSRVGAETLNTQRTWERSIAVLLTIGGAGTVFYSPSTLGLRELYAEAPPVPGEMVFEKPKKKQGISREENRDMISSQHLQVKQSWENPGVYAWGSNSGRVAAPDSDEAFIKTPRRISFFNGQLLRDIKLDRNFGAAIMENGDLVQWGIAYSAESRQPTTTLKGKDLTQLAVSRDRILALSSSGKVYSLPVSQADQHSGPKPMESSWFWSSTPSPISYRIIDTPNSEKIKAISSGLDHVLLLGSTGRLYAAASSSTDFPSKGQLGVPGLTFTSRPPGAYDQAHELTTLRGFNIVKIAAGDYHSLAADTEGRLFAFGDNTLGQLGFDISSDSPYIDAPSLLPITRMYAGSNQTPRVTDVFAGGVNSFLTVDATQVVPQDPSSKTISRIPVGRVTADTWAFGQGTFGTLGTGRWTHAQDSPAKLKSLSGLFEWDEKSNAAVPIRLARLSVGSTHAAATMANVTHVGAHAGSSENDTNWGADVVWWGGNEYWQLGTGKRNNVATPVYIRPLDSGKEKGKGEEHRFQCTPKGRVKVDGRWVDMEQRVECGRMVSAVYSGAFK